ncbi:hypothetical protein [Kordiimonas marina]|uniref:hypothetical protein n=1 Tax=Kordiimonas marina TaxID=2872312 RepID=UPI001FF4AA1C|nr:hypothetical protein [Kordiimonas marina]MCJ9429948.1 hypothetical protein [Kordiimonas marina]
MTLRASILGKNGRRLLSGLMMVSALYILWTGVPRFLAEVMIVPGRPILEKVRANTQVSAKDLSTLEQSFLSAISFADLPQFHAELGTSYLVQAQHTNDRQKRLEFAKMAIEESQISLDKAPLNPFAWERISVAQIILGHYDDAIRAWRSSSRIASFEPFLLMQRIHIGIILYQHLSSNDIRLLKQQIKMAFHWQRWIMRHYVRTYHLTSWVTYLSGPDSDISAFLKKH